MASRRAPPAKGARPGTAPVGGGQELIAPVDRGPQGALAVGDVARAGRKFEPSGEAAFERGDAEQRNALGREFERQRQAVQPPTYPFDGLSLLPLPPRRGPLARRALAPETAQPRRPAGSGVISSRCSPPMRSGSRLVTRTSSPGAAASRWLTTSAAPIRCSKLSMTSSI